MWVSVKNEDSKPNIPAVRNEQEETVPESFVEEEVVSMDGMACVGEEVVSSNLTKEEPEDVDVEIDVCSKVTQFLSSCPQINFFFRTQKVQTKTVF